MARDAELAEGLGDAPQEVVASKGVLVPQLDNQVVLQVVQRGRASEKEKGSERERREREREERARERESERERARKSGRGGAREGRTELERSGNGLGREEGKGVSGRNQWMRRMGDSRSEGAGSGIMQALRTRTGKKIINVYTHTSEITNKQPNV